MMVDFMDGFLAALRAFRSVDDVVPACSQAVAEGATELRLGGVRLLTAAADAAGCCADGGASAGIAERSADCRAAGGSDRSTA
jgi:hypothetical protein